MDVSGNVYVADSINETIRKVTPAGVVSTLAGMAGQYGSDDGTGANARFFELSGVAVDGSGNVYVADTGNYTIRKVTPAGVVSTLAGMARQSGSADGTGAAARFNNPNSVAVDRSGNVYVADTNNNTIRKITPAGVVSTIAGSAGQDGNVDGAGAVARFNYPRGIDVNGYGNIYVADTGNNTIRMVTPAGVVSTVVGVPGRDGTLPGPLPASLHSPYDVAFDSTTGSLFILVGDAVLKANL
jgi:sugar lactone lactonase YvrE